MCGKLDFSEYEIVFLNHFKWIKRCQRYGNTLISAGILQVFVKQLLNMVLVLCMQP